MKRIVSALMLVLVLFLSGCGDGDTGSQGVQGPQGIQGEKGDKGDPGVNGTSFLAGNGAPAAELGNVGDSYLDRLTGDFYGPKTADGWGEPIEAMFTGPQGEQGIQGLQGIPGVDGTNAIGAWVFTGCEPPRFVEGARKGDLYFSLNENKNHKHNVYVMTASGAWDLLGEISK